MKKSQQLNIMFTLVVAISIVAVLPIHTQAAQPEAAPSTKATIMTTKAKVVPDYDPALVPVGKTYRLMDGDKIVKEFPAGTATKMIRGDCIKIKCPPNFPEGTVCWHCYKREEEKEKKKAE